MKEEIILFIKKFNSIRSLGYVKSINNDNSGIGLTFEKIIGKESDNYPLPDFHNLIEIKTKLVHSKTPIHLFKLTPNGNSFLETKSLYEKYGYFSNCNKNVKVFNGTIYANKILRIGKYYYFSLDVNYINKKVKLLVYNSQMKMIDCSTYWDFDSLENALSRKLNYLALVLACQKIINNEKYYKYIRYDIYKLSNFDTFLKLLSSGVIGITFSIDVYKTEKRFGQIHDHGTTFNINKNDIEKLFKKII